MGAGGLRESEGRFWYTGSSLRVYPGELGMVMLRLHTHNRSQRVGPEHTICRDIDVHGQIVRGRLRGALAGDKTAPSLVALVDDLGRVLLVLRLAGERELVLGLAIGDLVDPTNRKLAYFHE